MAIEPEVVVAGHICLDVIPSFKNDKGVDISDIFIPGKLVNMGEVTVSTGGPVSNSGLNLIKLGVDTQLMGKIGNDFFGQGIINLLEDKQAHQGMIVDKDEQTSYTVVIVPPGIDRIFLHNPGATNTFSAADINYELVSRAKLFHFGYPPLMKKIYQDDGRELIEIFKKVKEMGVTTSLDMSLPDQNSDSGRVDWEKVLKNLLPYVDIFLPSVEETMFMIDKKEFEVLNHNLQGGQDMLDNLEIKKLNALGHKLTGFGAKIVGIKCGYKGFYVKTQSKEVLSQLKVIDKAKIDNWFGRELHQESFYVEDVASATGSGDSSIAGFLTALLRGKSIEKTLKIACAVGAQNVTAFDAISGIKDWDYTLDMVAGEGKMNSLTVESSDWEYDGDKQLWVGKRDMVLIRR